MPDFRTLRAAVLGVVTAALAACAVGPDYERPDVTVPGRFARDAAATDGEVAAVAVATPDPDAEFWASFDDPMLTRLVDAALRANHDLRIALARYDSANALLREARFDRFPTVTATGAASDARSSADQVPGVARGDRDTESYDAAIVAGWELDLFGRVRRNVESQRADTRGQRIRPGRTAGRHRRRGGAQLPRAARPAGAPARRARERGQPARDPAPGRGTRVDAGRGTEFDTSRARAQLETTLSRVPALEAAVAVTHAPARRADRERPRER